MIGTGLADAVCSQDEKLRLLFLLSMTMLGIMILWLPFVDLGSGTSVIVVMNVVGATGFGVFSGSFLWWCKKRKQSQREREREAKRRGR